MVCGIIVGFSPSKKTCILLLPDGRVGQVPKSEFANSEEGSLVEIDANKVSYDSSPIEPPPSKRMRCASIAEAFEEIWEGGDESSDTTHGKPCLKMNCYVFLDLIGLQYLTDIQ